MRRSHEHGFGRIALRLLPGLAPGVLLARGNLRVRDNFRARGILLPSGILPTFGLFLALGILLALGSIVGCDDSTLEAVSKPATPQGPMDLNPGETGTFSTGGAVSTEGHAVQYRFDLDAGGAHRYTAWADSDSVTVSWPDTARYDVRAQARCAAHTDVVSDWSGSLMVGVGMEAISTPEILVARSVPWPQLPDSFCTTGAISAKGHPLDYHFEFSDGTDAPWDSATCVSHTWSAGGDQMVFVRARCRIHPDALSQAATLEVPLTPPQMRFATHIDGVSHPYPTEEPIVPPDTVGMFKPFAISYHGLSLYGAIAGYEFRVGAYPGPPVWNPDTSDTLRSFTNTGAEAFDSGVTRFYAQCIDVANAQSLVEKVEVVVNFDPDTRFLQVWNTYKSGGSTFRRDIDFNDAIPDTVPFRSWLTIRYQGDDDPRDTRTCVPADPGERCVGFQIAYRRDSDRIPGAFAHSGWLPRGSVQDTDPLAPIDSNTANIGSVEYDWLARTVDEYGRADGTPPSVHIVGNYDPEMDSLLAIDHFENEVNLDGTGPVDTLTWNFWKGAAAGIDPLTNQPRHEWPYQAVTDTIDFSDPELPYIKRFQFRIRARGHDHPSELDGSGVKAWEYYIYTDYGQPTEQFWPLGGAGYWIDGVSVNVLDDVIDITFRYPGLSHPTLPPDPTGDTVFANLPGWINRDLTLVVRGRDTATNEPAFSQWVHLNGEPVLINQYPTGILGRWTEQRVATFHLKFTR